VNVGSTLLVVQQATASHSDVQVVECDKAEKSFAVYYGSDLRLADGDTLHTCKGFLALYPPWTYDRISSKHR